jgi:segregation and condensation protein B
MKPKLPGTTKSMSKRKSRRKPLTSEIQSVMRAPTDLEGDAVDGAAEDADVLDADVLDADLLNADALDADTQSPEPEAETDSSRGEHTSPAPSEDVHEAAAPDAGGEAPASPHLDLSEPSDSEPAAARGKAPKRRRADPSVQLHAVSNAPEEPATAAEYFEALDMAELSRPLEEEEGSDSSFEPITGADADDTEAFLRGLIEALLFTSQRPLALKDIARSAGLDRQRAQELLEQLIRDYAPRGLCIEEVAGGFVMRSSARYAPYIQKLLALRPIRLSRAQLETLAIVAYRQPVTKPEVDDIRGVDSGQVIKGLLDRALLKIMGKKDEPGRPMLYGTTNDFLELLNLQSLKDLPTLREYTELSEESQRKFMEETGEAAPSAGTSVGTATFEGTPLQGAEQPTSVTEQNSDSRAGPGAADASEPDTAQLDASDGEDNQASAMASDASEPADERRADESSEVRAESAEARGESTELAADEDEAAASETSGLGAFVPETDASESDGDADEDTWQPSTNFADDMGEADEDSEPTGTPAATGRAAPDEGGETSAEGEGHGLHHAEPESDLV